MRLARTARANLPLRFRSRPSGPFPVTLPCVSFTVSFTGQGKDEGIVVDSLARAVARVLELKPEQFPAAIWQIPETDDRGRGRLIRKYPAPPAP
jgi:hypothetical protein